MDWASDAKHNAYPAFIVWCEFRLVKRQESTMDEYSRIISLCLIPPIRGIPPVDSLLTWDGRVEVIALVTIPGPGCHCRVVLVVRVVAD